MVAKMRNGGEACTAANRFYVERSIAEEFSRGLAERMGALRVGPGVDADTQVGPLVNDDTAGKVDELVQGAVAEGATAVVGGRRPDRPGFYYEPTVLSGVLPGSAILSEEIFGPVAPIVVFDTEDEAIRLANDTEYGLVSYVFTGDLARGLRVERGDGVGHGRPEPRRRQRPGRAVRRDEAERRRPRGRPRGHARLPGEQVHRRRLVTPASRDDQVS